MRVPLLADLVDLLLPVVCEVCGVEDPCAPSLFCAPCRTQLPRLPERLCGRCGLPLTSFRHGECVGCRMLPPRFDRARAIAPYAGVLLTAIQRFKYGGVRGLAEPLAGLLVERDPYRAEATELVVPVPLGARRFERGFNQAALLALGYGRRSGRPVGLSVLGRSVRGPRQAGASRGSRLDNVSGAFRVRRPSAVAGRPVLLVDDVITTGATADACAAALLAAGATRVRVLALARTLEDRSRA